MKTTNKFKAGALAIAIALTGCMEEKTTETDYVSDRGKTTTPATEMVPKSVQDSMEKIFTETLNEIDLNLEMIREKEGGIVLGPGSASEDNIPKKEKIIRNINMLNSLIAESNTKIEKLNKQIRNFKLQNSKLEKLTAQFTEQIAEHEKNINALKEELSARNFEIADLNKQLVDLRFESGWNKSVAEQVGQEAEKYKKDMNTAYYTMGSKAELKEEGVIAGKGGVVGLGRTPVVKGDVKPEQFTKIDIRETKSIPVNAKKAKLVSVHNEGSYEFQKEGETIAALEIKNPEEFWRQSKFMVLEVKE